ncbi:hypothetical protein Tco_0150123 [Tanacetum coccineum]
MLTFSPSLENHKDQELAVVSKFSGSLRVEANLGIRNNSKRKANLETHLFEDFIEFVDLFISLITALFIITPRRIWKRNCSGPTGGCTVQYFVNKKGALGLCPPRVLVSLTEEDRNLEVLDMQHRFGAGAELEQKLGSSCLEQCSGQYP